MGARTISSQISFVLLFTWLFCSASCNGARLAIVPKNHIVVKQLSNLTDSTSSVSRTTTLEVALTIVSVSSHPSITAATTLSNSVASDNSTSTITTAPEWGNQSIPINTCSTVDDTEGGQTIWTPCHVYAGTVQLSYFPEASGNVSYPTTYYNPVLSATLTSPSVYLVVNTITGSNECGSLGPNYAKKLISMDLTDVYTLQPYADASATTRIGEPQPLTLSDLADCTYTTSAISTLTIDETRNDHPLNGTYNRCNPRLVFPVQLKRLGYPYWKHCGNNNYNIGLFDPPGAVPSVDSLFTSVVSAFPSTTEASAAPTAAPDLASSTQTPDQATSTTPAEIQSNLPTDTSAVSPETSPGTQAGANTTPGGVLIQSSIHPLSTATTGIVAVIGTNTISAVAGSGVILGGSTATVGQVATLTDSTGGTAIVSVGKSGVFVGGTDSKTTFFANPTQAPSFNVIATLAGQTISAALGDSTIVVDGQTITSGGAEITISGSENVITFGPAGLIVKNSGGMVSTFAIPTATLNPQLGVTVAGSEVKETAEASQLVIGTQTATLGGKATPSANHDLVSVGSSGIVVQYPGGAVSSASLRTSALSNTSGASMTTNKVAVAIASIIGVSNSNNVEASSTSTITGSTAKFTGAANVLSGNRVVVYGIALLGLIFGL